MLYSLQLQYREELARHITTLKKAYAEQDFKAIQYVRDDVRVLEEITEVTLDEFDLPEAKELLGLMNDMPQSDHPIFPEETERAKEVTRKIALEWWKKLGTGEQDTTTRLMINPRASHQFVNEDEIINMYKRTMNMFAGGKVYKV